MDLSKYDRLNNATLAEWVSEFLSRNNEFRKDIQELHIDHDINRRIPLIKNIWKKYRVHIPFKSQINDRTINVRLLSNIKALRVLPKDIDENDPRIAKLENNLIDYSSENASIEGLEKEKHYHYVKGLNFDGIQQTIQVYLLDGDFNNRDNLLLAIDLNQSKESILNELDEIFKIHKTRKQSSARTDKWKYYLIVFDLKKENYSYSEIADILIAAYPNNKNLFDDNNIIKYYDRVIKLISGEYTKYI